MATGRVSIGTVGGTPVFSPNGISSASLLTDEVRVALCSAIAAWRHRGDITVFVSDPKRWNDGQLPELLSYILHYPRHIDRLAISILPKYDSSVPPTQLKSGRVVLSSGGIDSTATLLSLMTSRETLSAYWVDYGQKYADAESSSVRHIADVLAIQLRTGRFDLSSEIQRGETEFGHIVPARNVLLAALAVADSGAAEVLLSGLEDEALVPDKSPRFFKFSELLVGARVFSPFMQSTKTDLLARWRRDWKGILHPSETVSCYQASGGCGTCAACTKRAVAFAASGWGDDESLQVDPLTDPVGLIQMNWLPRWNSLPPKRQADLLLAFRYAEGRLPRSVAEFARSQLTLQADLVQSRLLTLGLSA